MGNDEILVVDVDVDTHVQPSISRSDTVHSQADARHRASAPHSGSVILISARAEAMKEWHWFWRGLVLLLCFGAGINGGPARPHAEAGDFKPR
jgi:hypothetical protein